MHLIGPAIDCLDLPADQLGRLRARGIVCLAQLVDVLLRSEKPWVRCLLASVSSLKEHGGVQGLERRLSPSTISALRGTRFEVPPLTGIAGPSAASPELVRIRKGNCEARKKVVNLLNHIASSDELPSKVLLVDYMTTVRDQGRLGSCTGWGSTANREFLAEEELAPLFAYALARHLDGHPELVGSWQYFAFLGFVKFGHLRERDYPYTDNPGDLDIEPYAHKAAEFAAEGFADVLLDPEDMKLQPTLMKAILSGRLNGKLGPQPVSISIAVHESFDSPSTALYGTVQVPGEAEACLGGHALCAVGYIDGDDPDAIFGQDYFVVKNSWGTAWAVRNPLGLPGYALIPAQYFTEPRLLWEALVCIAEPSPLRVARSHIGWLRSLWDPQHVPPPAYVYA